MQNFQNESENYLINLLYENKEIIFSNFITRKINDQVIRIQ